MCCGHQQHAVNADRTRELSTLKLLYFGQSYVQLTGDITGQLYHFSPLHPIQAVDPRDAESMTQTGLFRPVR
jgi:hypothetical protein